MSGVAVGDFTLRAARTRAVFLATFHLCARLHALTAAAFMLGLAAFLLMFRMAFAMLVKRLLMVAMAARGSGL
jgi:hypothetical protein